VYLAVDFTEASTNRSFSKLFRNAAWALYKLYNVARVQLQLTQNVRHTFASLPATISFLFTGACRAATPTTALGVVLHTVLSLMSLI